jgi:hypothetical protein
MIRIEKVFYILKERIGRLRTIISDLYSPNNMTFGEFTFKFRGSLLPHWMRKELKKNIENYEKEERILVSKYLSKGDYVLEAGTSIGLLSGHISQIIGLDGKLVTVEPDFRLQKIAKDLNVHMSNAEFINGGLFVLKDDKNWGFIPSGWLGGRVVPLENDNEAIEIEKYYLENLIGKYSINSLVLDIEGTEKRLLERPQINSNIKTLIIELHPLIYGESVKEKILKVLSQYYKFKLKEQINDVYAFTR